MSSSSRLGSRIRTLFCLLFYNATFLSFVKAADSVSWSLSTPIQCANMTLTVDGGIPPYQLLVIPVGNVVPETRRILALNTSSNNLSFELKFPAKSQFLAVVSDSTRFASGGTGVPVTVAANDDASCLTVTEAPDFYFYIAPDANLTQCESVQFSWSNKSEGHVSIIGIVPGGETFRLNAPDNNNFFNWTVNARAGTTVELIAGDDRGPGTGGSTTFVQVGDGPNGCIDDTSPSSTAGSPAGGNTGTPSPSTSSSTGGGSTPSSSQRGRKSSNTGAVVGGVIGGLVGLALLGSLLFFFCRRRTDEDSEPGRVDLTHGEEPNRVGSDPPRIGAGLYGSEPLVIPDPSSRIGSPSTGADVSNGHRISTIAPSNSSLPANSMPLDSRRESQLSMGQLTQTTDPISSGAGMRTRTTGNSKGYPPSSLRAVNIVQHMDGGVPAEEEPPQEEVVELPPTYSEVRKPNRNADGNEPVRDA